MTHPNASGVQGEILVSFEILSIEEAHAFPAGFGRKEPNMNPTLEPPKRPEDSMAPWEVNKQVALAAKNLKGKMGLLFGSWKIKAIGICICIVIIVIIVIAVKFWILGMK